MVLSGFQDRFSISVKNEIRNFTGAALKLQNSFARMVIFIILILPIHEHGMLFSFSSVFLYLFLQRFKFFIAEVLYYLGEVCLSPFETIVNRSVEV